MKVILMNILSCSGPSLVVSSRDTEYLTTFIDINARLAALQAIHEGSLVAIVLQKEVLLLKGRCLSSFDRLSLELQTTIFEDHLDLDSRMERRKRKLDLLLVSSR